MRRFVLNETSVCGVVRSQERILVRSIFITPSIIQTIQVVHQGIKDDEARATDGASFAENLGFNGRLEVVLFARKNQLVHLAPRKARVRASGA